MSEINKRDDFNFHYSDGGTPFIQASQAGICQGMYENVS